MALSPLIALASIMLTLVVLTFLHLLIESARNGMHSYNIASLGLLIQKIIFCSCILAQLVRGREYIGIVESGKLHGPDGKVVMKVTECLMPISVLASLALVRVSRIIGLYALNIDFALQAFSFLWSIFLRNLHLRTGHDSSLQI